mmetsp:Transcript_10084/g.29817  ORF Transcript_10084/g.29817 Transcript_10084/m.29817 type:complete len:308 (-) Transcript_10084:756-1679(-)
MLSLSDRSLSATCSVFSCGSFFVPGSWSISFRMRPSLKCSDFLTMNLARRPEPWTIRSSTISTTRTIVLCFSASSISRDAPLCSSSVNSSSVLAVALPNSLVLMPWSVSIESMTSMLPATLPLSVGVAFRALDMLRIALPLFSIWSVVCHSNLTFRCLPPLTMGTSKLGFQNVARGSQRIVPFISCSLAFLEFSRRSTRSLRRSAWPALPPRSKWSGLKSLSFSSSPAWTKEVSFASHGSAKASFASGLSSSFFVSIISMKFLPDSGALLGSLTAFRQTSDWPLKGNLPSTRPKVTIPHAQTSHFTP